MAVGISKTRVLYIESIESQAEATKPLSFAQTMQTGLSTAWSTRTFCTKVETSNRGIRLHRAETTKHLCQGKNVYYRIPYIVHHGTLCRSQHLCFSECFFLMPCFKYPPGAHRLPFCTCMNSCNLVSLCLHLGNLAQ